MHPGMVLEQKEGVSVKKILGLALVSALIVLPAAGVMAEETDTVKANEEYNIAFSLKTINGDAFQQAIARAAQDAAEAAGCSLELVIAGSQTDVDTQAQQIEEVIDGEVDALIINPMDAGALIPALEKAAEKNIPVVLVDSTIEEGNEDLYVTYIGTDNYAAAEEGAKVLSDAVGEGKVIIVRGADGNSVGNARADGFKAGMGPAIELVSEAPGNWDNDTAKQVTGEMLEANPDVKGILSCSDVMVEGILQAIDEAGLEDIKIMSFDGDSVELIKEGKVLGTMAQFPSVMGETAIETIVQILNGDKAAEDFEKYIDSGTDCYTIDNLPE